MSRPKILFVGHQSSKKSCGGTESATRVFELLKNDFNWEWITNRESAFVDRWRSGGAEVRIIPAQVENGRLALSIALARTAFEIWRAIRQSNIDIIHANGIRAAAAAYPISNLYRKPLVLSVRGSKSTKYGILWPLVIRGCNKIITLSNEMQDLLHNNFTLKADQTKVIYSEVQRALDMQPVGLEQKIKVRRVMGIGDNEFAIGVVGAVRPIKGQLEFIKHCASKIFRTCSEAKVHFLGDFDPDNDKYASLCLEAAEASGYGERLVFHDFVDNVYQWYLALDIVAICSKSEGMARCMIEPLALGTPVVSFDVCSAREVLLEQELGIVVNHGDYSQLALEVAKLVSNPELVKRLSLHAKTTTYELFNSSKMASAYKSLYIELAK